MIAERVAAVRERIARAAERARRDPGDVRLVAVSKTQPIEAVREAFAAGVRDFGENRVQEAESKIAASGDLVAAGASWHLVGHLQSNKARKAVSAFDVIHSIDGVDLLEKVDAAAAEVGREPELLIQVDLAGETTKSGAPEADLPAIFDAAGRLKVARLVGMMLLPPYAEDPEEARSWFRRLREIRDGFARQGVDARHLRELSMGMSHDFPVAIEEGATTVRVGTAIFGERPPVSGTEKPE